MESTWVRYACKFFMCVTLTRYRYGKFLKYAMFKFWKCRIALLSSAKWLDVKLVALLLKWNLILLENRHTWAVTFIQSKTLTLNLKYIPKLKIGLAIIWLIVNQQLNNIRIFKSKVSSLVLGYGAYALLSLAKNFPITKQPCQLNSLLWYQNNNVHLVTCQWFDCLVWSFFLHQSALTRHQTQKLGLKSKYITTLYNHVLFEFEFEFEFDFFKIDKFFFFYFNEFKLKK